MDDVVDFLRARLDDDERVARAATPGPWRLDSTIHAELLNAGDGTTVIGGGRWGGEASVFESTEDAIHIAEWDPSRVLREIDAKRRIVDIYADALEERAALRARMREVIHSDSDEFGRLHQQESELIEAAERAAPVVRLLAMPYGDRPGYREEWRP
ncbi:DUF6221 family protein [Streptomyces sp. NPDC057617]|uniref:DUF6221 family protein n=1 Tax=Streptomyces sp. NPDC057617 TaxID=3346184 RepID=UPI00368DCC50